MHWILDHAETISPRNIERVEALRGGIAIQHRMAYQGDYFVATPCSRRYGDVYARRSGATQTNCIAAGNEMSWTNY